MMEGSYVFSLGVRKIFYIVFIEKRFVCVGYVRVFGN